MTGKVREDSYWTARDFLEALRPSREEWAGEWIFRGQMRADWKLRPTAFRVESWAKFGAYPKDDFARYSDMSSFEVDELVRFALGLDRVGLAIPGINCREIKELLAASVKPRFWIPKLAELMALAQHHGLPTRLLDFTHSGVIAAYFAAQLHEGSLADELEDLSVWALNSEIVGTAMSSSEQVTWCRVLQTSRSGNDRQVAQNGTFVVWENELYDLEKILETVEPNPYSLYVEERKLYRGPTAIKMTLPRTEAKALLGLLARENVTAASLFPGPGGVIQHRLEQSYHDVYSEGTPAIVSWNRAK